MAMIRYTAVDFVLRRGRTFDEAMDAPTEWQDRGPAYVDSAVIAGILPDEGATSILLHGESFGAAGPHRLRARESVEEIRRLMVEANKPRRGRGK